MGALVKKFPFSFIFKHNFSKSFSVKLSIGKKDILTKVFHNCLPGRLMGPDNYIIDKIVYKIMTHVRVQINIILLYTNSF